MKEQNIRGHKLSAMEREAQISNKLEIEIFILTCQVIPEAVAVFLTDRQTDRQRGLFTRCCFHQAVWTCTAVQHIYLSIQKLKINPTKFTNSKLLHVLIFKHLLSLNILALYN